MAAIRRTILIKMEEIKQFLKSKGFTKSTVKTYSSILTDVFNKIGRNLGSIKT